MIDFGSTYERLELKYLIGEADAESIRAAIQPFCVPDAFNPSEGARRGYTINNLYLDTSDWTFFQQWRRKDRDRIKLRIRTYDVGPAFLEVKRKTVDVISKTRAKVAREEVEACVRGFGRTLSGSPREERLLNNFSYFAARTGAEPRVYVRYEREAWVGTLDRYARVTFDRRLTAQAEERWFLQGDAQEHQITMDDPWHYDGLQSPLILELKCETRMPVWMSDLIRHFSLTRRGFSKYGFGVDGVLREALGWASLGLAGADYV